jgi:hypothetical protein
MDHVVCALGVFHHAVENYCEKYDHKGQHDRVTLIKGVFLDSPIEKCQWDQKAQV